MKFVHIADMHFDSPFTLLSNTSNLGEIRRIDQRKVLKKIIEYIKENDIPYLFIAGDLYEQEYIRQSTIEYINNLFKEINNTKIFIVPGNHDPYLNNSYYNKFNWNENVKIFTSKLEKLEFPEFDLYGFGFEDFYMKDSKINEINIENKEKINILITHGNLDGGCEEQRNYNPMSSSKLKQLGFDYIALGHIHKLNLSDENKRIIYPGSTISMGFDELGEHGMLVGDITKEEINVQFIKLDDKEFKEINLDISDINNVEELLEKILENKYQENIFYKIVLTGKRKFEINIFKIFKMIDNKNIIKIKDKTIPDYNLDEIANDFSLKGIFVKEALNKLNDENIDKEILEKAIEIGMNIL